MTQSLYRKWRPQTFQDLKGQDVIRDTLFYAATHDQLSQAYLFCGPRGTGKTTTARLLAKVINCMTEAETRPCNACSACQTITEGSNLDVIELDAASNRGIDEIRQLRETVRFAPTQAKWKVFIIDEVHMLTREAFNALLKTLEEPPSHTIFILATTEAHKIPPTIISRCQRYDFRLATLDALTQHLQAVAEAEGMHLSSEAARFVARLGQGSFRDSLSILEQVRSAHHKEYTLAVVESLFGYVSHEQAAQCFSLAIQGDVAGAHAVLDTVLEQGADIKAFTDQLIGLSQQIIEALIVKDETVSPVALAAARSAGLGKVVLWTERLLEAAHQIKQCPIPRLPLDLVIAKCAADSRGVAASPVASSVNAVATLPPPQTVAHTAPKVEVKEPAPVVVTEIPPVHETVSVPVAIVLPQTLDEGQWHAILQELKKEAPSLVTSLSHAKVLGIEGDLLKVAVKYKMHSDKINQTKNRARIDDVILAITQLPLRIEAQIVKDLPDITRDSEEVDITQVFDLEE